MTPRRRGSFCLQAFALFTALPTTACVRSGNGQKNSTDLGVGCSLHPHSPEAEGEQLPDVPERVPIAPRLGRIDAF